MAEAAKRIQSPQDWQRLKDIQTQSKQAKENEQMEYRNEYPARLADAGEAILKERGNWHYTHPAPQSAARRDRFDKDQIERQAHLRVHSAHAQTIAKIDKQESREVRQLLRATPSPPPQAEHAFARQQTQIKRER